MASRAVGSASAFELAAVVLIAVWLLVVGGWLRRSPVALIGGLVTVGLLVAAAILGRFADPQTVGLGQPGSWALVAALALAWLGVMWAYSPVADRLASRVISTPPTLGVFRAIQESPIKLAAGVGVAWLLGGFLEELALRGVLLKSVSELTQAWLGGPGAAAAAVLVAAGAAAIIHIYQGPRAVLIITQLSILFGILFIISGYRLWAVIICHGTYDTIAFILFAMKKSKYSQLDADDAATGQATSVAAG